MVAGAQMWRRPALLVFRWSDLRQSADKSSQLNDTHHQALARIVESGPIPEIHDVVCWRWKGLALWPFGKFRISLEETSVAAARALFRHDATPRPCSCILLKSSPR